MPDVREAFAEVARDLDMKRQMDAITRGGWDCPENAIAELMQRMEDGRDILDHGVVIGKAVTLYQPYASFMAVNEKRLETRSWSTNYRGTVFIHAGMRLPAHGSPEEAHARELLRGSAHLSETPLLSLPRGVLISCGTLVDCVRMDEAFCARMEDTREYQLGWYAPGRYAWMFEDMQPLPELVPIKGQLSLWDVRI